MTVRRTLIVLAALLVAAARPVGAQSVVERVRAVAPELVGFAGSAENFRSLVTGLAEVREIRLTTPLASGDTQLVQFRPANGPIDAKRIARALRKARASLERLQLRDPDGQQVAAALTGGVVETPTGAFRLAGLLPGAGQGFDPGYRKRIIAGAPPLRASADVALRAPSIELGPPPDPDLVLFAGSTENLTSLLRGLHEGLPITLAATTPPDSAITFRLPLPPLPRRAALALLQRARALLLREAIAAPTPLQLRAALFALT